MSRLLYFTQALVEGALALLLFQFAMLLAQYVDWVSMFEGAFE